MPVNGAAIEVGLLWLLARGTSWWQHREMSDAISSSLHSLRHFSDPATYEPYHVIWGWSRWKCGWGQIPLPEQQQHVNEVAVTPHWPWLECLNLHTSFRLWEIVLHIKMTCPSIHRQTDLFTFYSCEVSHILSICWKAAFKNGIICAVYLQAISCVVIQNMRFHGTRLSLRRFSRKSQKCKSTIFRSL